MTTKQPVELPRRFDSGRSHLPVSQGSRSDVAKNVAREPETWASHASGPFKAKGARIAKEPAGAAPAAPQALGLSENHISAPHPFVEIHVGGGLGRVCMGRPAMPASQKEKKPRGKVREFSGRSRTRMRRTVAATDMSKLPLFVHLTYPAEFAEDPTIYKSHLDNFALRLLRRFPESGFIWKLEFQKRGAPHFHLFVWGIGDREPFKPWLSQAWYETVGSGDLKHLAAGTRVERIQSRKKAMAYCSGYASKDDQTKPGEYVGRYWGACQRENIPWAKLVHVEVTEKQAKGVRRTMRRFTLASLREGFLRRRKLGIKGPKPRIRNNDNIVAFLDGSFWLKRLAKLLT